MLHTITLASQNALRNFGTQYSGFLDAVHRGPVRNTQTLVILFTNHEIYKIIILQFWTRKKPNLIFKVETLTVLRACFARVFLDMFSSTKLKAGLLQSKYRQQNIAFTNQMKGIYIVRRRL